MKTIIVPSDFSKNSDHALKYAIRLSRSLKAKLVVFHCTHLPAFIIAGVSADEQLRKLIADDIQYKTEKLHSQVAKAYKNLGNGKVPSTLKIIVEYKPLIVENIMEVSKACRADLVVMGTHGTSGISRFFFGSHTAELISKSDIPVLAIPENYRYVPVKNVVYSSDLDHLPAELKRVLPFVKAVGASLRVLHLDYGIDNSAMKIEKARAAINKCGYKKINFVQSRATIEYSLDTQLQKFLSRSKTQWLVMYTKERSFWNKIIYGGKTERMSYSLKIPLLSFRK